MAMAMAMGMAGVGGAGMGNVSTGRGWLLTLHGDGVCGAMW